jgi:Fur family ferric uptake transcriptional regulator
MKNKMRPPNYNTRQGKFILDYLASLGDSHVTVNGIVRHFEDEGIAVSQTTVYRHLEKMAEKGLIRKYVLDGAGVCYQYIEKNGNCREHFHLVCENCGELFHLDCDLLNRLRGHLLKEHRFELNGLKTILYGRCEKCRN